MSLSLALSSEAPDSRRRAAALSLLSELDGLRCVSVVVRDERAADQRIIREVLITAGPRQFDRLGCGGQRQELVAALLSHPPDVFGESGRRNQQVRPGGSRASG